MMKYLFKMLGTIWSIEHGICNIAYTSLKRKIKSLRND